MAMGDADQAKQDPPGHDDRAAPIDAESATEAEAWRQRVIEAISTVYDPEIPVNIYEHGPKLRGCLL